MGRFDARATQPSRGPRELLRWQLEKLRGPGARGPQPGAPRRENDGASIASLPASLTWVGHASFVVRLGGKRCVIDPVWSTRLGGVTKRLVEPGVALEKVGPIDVVLLTHNHRDHCDVPTLQRLGPKPLYVVPLGNGALVREAAGAERVIELDWWQTHHEDGLSVTLVPARHWSMRLPWDRNDMLWGGYVLRGAEGAAYHSGDTALFDAFTEIGQRCGPLDWALLPIGAYAPRWFMQPQHMNPDDALQAFAMLGARTFVAMHWGTFKLTDEPTGEPPERLLAGWREAGLPSERLWLMDVGETRELR